MPGLHPRSERLQQQFPRGFRIRDPQRLFEYRRRGQFDCHLLRSDGREVAFPHGLTRDTIYYLGVVDLSKGPMVIEQPPKGLGTINDMWFSWIIDVGSPGPDRGEGGKYLLIPPGYDGPLPEGGFFVAHSKTNRVLYAARSFLVDNDPKPTVELIKKHLKIYPIRPAGSERASQRPSKATSASR